MIHAFESIAPTIAPDAFVHSSAHVIGDVHIGAGSSIWFNAVVRGDVHFIRIGDRTNIQDNATVHVTTDRWPTYVGNDVTVGHAAVLHGCTIGNGVLIGISAVIMDGCKVGDGCLVGAGSLIPPRMVVPPGHLILGSPARVIRPLSAAEVEKVARSSDLYVRHSQKYREQGLT